MSLETALGHHVSSHVSAIGLKAVGHLLTSPYLAECRAQAASLAARISRVCADFASDALGGAADVGRLLADVAAVRHGEVVESLEAVRDGFARDVEDAVADFAGDGTLAA